jgi:uncharacterized protein YaiE (UPF0345 family)
MPHPTQFEQVTVTALANVYFEGGVVSHSLQLPNGSKKTLGLIRPGAYTFNTGAAEEMAITAGACRVKIKGETAWRDYAAGQAFTVPAHSAFEITVESGLCQYICSFLA